MAFSLNSTTVGLTTISTSIPTAAQLPIKGTLSVPDLTKGDPASSQVVVTITQTPFGGSPTTIYTGLPGAEGFLVNANCAALDVIAITMSSSAAVDQMINAVKTTISIG